MLTPETAGTKQPCGLFDLMSRSAGIAVLHPGGHDATKRLCTMMQISRGHRVLDLACGQGRTSMFLHKTYGCDVTGIDKSEELIAKAKQALPAALAPSVRFETGDALHLPFPDASFDRVIAQDFFILIDDMDQALAEIHRVLKPGGVFVAIELSWIGVPSKKAYNELVDNTCSTLIPRVKPAEGWEQFFMSKPFHLAASEHEPMPSGLLQMVRAEGFMNSVKIMGRMIANRAIRKKTMTVQRTFSKFANFLGYGLFALEKKRQEVPCFQLKSTGKY